MALERFPNAALIHTDRLVVRTSKLPTEFPEHRLRNQDLILQPLRKSVLFRCNIVHSSALLPRELVLKVGKFNPHLRGIDDYHLFVKLALQGGIIRIALPLTYCYVHEANLSHVPNIFIDGLYRMAQEMKNEGMPAYLIHSIEAQAFEVRCCELVSEATMEVFSASFRKHSSVLASQGTSAAWDFGNLYDFTSFPKRQNDRVFEKRPKALEAAQIVQKDIFQLCHSEDVRLVPGGQNN